MNEAHKKKYNEQFIVLVKIPPFLNVLYNFKSDFLKINVLIGIKSNTITFLCALF